MTELEKMKYHIRLLAETIDFENSPIPCLVIGMDWAEEDLTRAHDIFERYDDALRNGTSVSWQRFQSELCNAFNIDYQRVKTIVLTFFENDQWRDVCTQYAKAYECVEFWGILGRYASQEKSE